MQNEQKGMFFFVDIPSYILIHKVIEYTKKCIGGIRYGKSYIKKRI
jgi:hypothetical protein